MEKRIPRGCEICLTGAKMVLFVTGVCDKSCFYCPLSEKRRGLDVVYADEIPVEEDLDVVLEARAIDAEGTGITGGDPLLRLSRTVRYIRILKDFFGERHHIHLYTSGRHASRESILELKMAGLDELRFHPYANERDRIGLAKELGMYAGAEMPAIPGGEGDLRELVGYMVRMKADFLNLNQLEFCPQNALQLKQRGFELAHDDKAAVQGSEQTALALIRWARDEGIEMPIHYCSSVAKDAIQMRGRLLRRGRNAAHPYEKVNDDGLLEKMEVKLQAEAGSSFKRKVARIAGVPPQMIGISKDGRSLETSRELLPLLMKGSSLFSAKAKIAYVQEYPTALRERFIEYDISS